MTSINCTKEELINILLDFIERHFNNFKHKRRDGNNTWFTPSWSPFIQACFIEKGRSLNLEVGSSYTSPNLGNFWKKYISGDYLTFRLFK